MCCDIWVALEYETCYDSLPHLHLNLSSQPLERKVVNRWAAGAQTTTTAFMKLRDCNPGAYTISH